MSIRNINSIPPEDLEVEDPEAGTVTSSPDIDLESVIESFLLVHPEPTDDQVHAFARSLGIDYDELEDKVYEMLGNALSDEPSEEDAVEELEPQDPLDTFILSFFLFNSAPSDEQVHALSVLINVPKEQVEERIYRMLADYEAGNDEEDDSGLGEFASATPDEDEEAEAEPGEPVDLITIAQGDGVGAESPNWEGSPDTTPLATTDNQEIQS